MSGTSPHPIHDAARVSELIGLIYDSVAAPTPAYAKKISEQIGQIFSLRAVNLAIASRHSTGDLRTILFYWGFTDQQVADYESRYFSTWSVTRSEVALRCQGWRDLMVDAS